MVAMTTKRRTYKLDVSEPLFRLATECVHQFSNEIKMIATLDEVVAALAPRAAQGFPGHASDTMRGHLASLSSEGAIQLLLNLDPATDDLFELARALLSDRLETQIALADIISATLFDFSVERASAQILGRLLGEGNSLPPGDAPEPPHGYGGTVVPIR